MALKLPASRTRGVKTIHRVIDLLEIFKQFPSGLTLSELSTYLEMPKSTVFRMLSVLIERQFIRESTPPGKYLLGYEVLRLSLAYQKGLNLYREAHPRLEALNLKLDETVILGVLDQTQHQIIYLDKLDTSKAIMPGSHIGETAPIHCTALGKALLSRFEREELSCLLAGYEFNKFTENTIDNLQEFCQEMEITKNRGYAIDLQEYKLHVVCIAAPIIDHSGKPLAAISVSAPANRLEELRIEIVAQSVVETANEISKLLAYVPVQKLDAK